MPLFVVEQNRIADDIAASDLTIYLHTSLPTDAAPANGRVTTGGGLFQSGATLAATGIGAASGGDLSNTAAVPFGTATAAVGTVIAVSAYRSTAPVGYWLIEAATIANGDEFELNAGALSFMGSSL